MHYTIDRIEEGIAVCEDDCGNRINIQLPFLPENVKEGDLLGIENGRFEILSDETQKRRKEIYEKQSRIFKKHK